MTSRPNPVLPVPRPILTLARGTICSSRRPEDEGDGEGVVKRYWDEQELAEHWSLTAEEWELLARRTDRSRLGLAILLKFFQVEGRFPRDRKEIPVAVRDHLADQLGIEPDAFAEYDLAGRSSKRDREQIRSVLGFRRVTVADAEGLVEWLRRDVLPPTTSPIISNRPPWIGAGGTVSSLRPRLEWSGSSARP